MKAEKSYSIFISVLQSLTLSLSLASFSWHSASTQHTVKYKTHSSLHSHYHYQLLFPSLSLSLFLFQTSKTKHKIEKKKNTGFSFIHFLLFIFFFVIYFTVEFSRPFQNFFPLWFSATHFFFPTWISNSAPCSVSSGVQTKRSEQGKIKIPPLVFLFSRSSWLPMIVFGGKLQTWQLGLANPGVRTRITWRIRVTVGEVGFRVFFFFGVWLKLGLLCMRSRIGFVIWMWRKPGSWCLWTQTCCSFRRFLLLHWNRILVLLRSYSHSGFHFLIHVAWYMLHSWFQTLSKLWFFYKWMNLEIHLTDGNGSGAKRTVLNFIFCQIESGFLLLHESFS